MTDFNLISPAERRALLDAIEPRAGQLGEAAVADLTARVEAAQTHAGLDAIRQELPPEIPTPVPPARPKLSLPKVSWPPISLPKISWRTISLPKVSWPRRDPWSLIPHAVFAVLVIAVIGKLIASNRDPVDEPARRTAGLPATTVTSHPASTPTSRPATTAPPVEPELISLQVGVDIQDGRYLTDNATGCSWVKPQAGVHYESSGTRHIVDLGELDGKFAYSPGCGEWKPYVPPRSPLSEFPDGSWLGDTDIEAGRYRSPGPADGRTSCTWQLGMDFSFRWSEESHWVEHPTEVTVIAGKRFNSSNCGTWTKIG